VPYPGATPKNIAAIRRTIAEDLEPFDAFHIIGTLMVVSLVHSSDNDFEPAPTTEYVASILLERTDGNRLRPQLQEPEKNAAIQRTLDRVRGLTLYGLHAGWRSAGSADTPLRAIAETVKTSDTVNRWPGYEPQLVEFLSWVVADPVVSKALSEQVGFDGREALACDRAIRELVHRRFFEWRDHVPEAIAAAEELWDSGRREVPPGLEVGGPGRSREQRHWWLVAQYLTSEHLIDVLSFDADELAEAAGLDRQVAASFIDCFSCPWGSSRGLTLVRGRSLVRRRPLLRHVDGRAHPTAHGNLLWAIRPAVEEALKLDRPAFEVYQQRRAQRCEQDAERWLATALRPDFSHTNLSYIGDGVAGEADVLQRVDDLLLVVEVKSGVLSEAAYSGRTAALKSDLKALIGRSAAQASRLRNAAEEHVELRFIDRATRTPISVDFEGVARVQTVVVTLEDLAPALARPDRLIAAGIVEGDVPLPWVVSLFDLQVIALSTEFPAQLTTYMTVRAQLDPRAEWPGEDDLWLTHLLANLSFKKVDTDRFMVDGRTDLLAKQWMEQRPAPRSDLPKATRKAMRRLSRKRPANWLRETEIMFSEAMRHRQPRVATGLTQVPS
jgi:hypothetical protein